MNFLLCHVYRHWFSTVTVKPTTKKKLSHRFTLFFYIQLTFFFENVRYTFGKNIFFTLMKIVYTY